MIVPVPSKKYTFAHSRGEVRAVSSLEDEASHYFAVNRRRCCLDRLPAHSPDISGSDDSLLQCQRNLTDGGNATARERIGSNCSSAIYK